jgi:hypothetical protein
VLFYFFLFSCFFFFFSAGYFQIFVIYRLVAVLFYFFLLRTLMRLGEPTLYVQRVAPEIDAVPDFCNSVTERQFRAVPQIIRGSVTRETLNRGVALLNQITADKYQLLALDLRELHALNTGETALELRKTWDMQRKTEDFGTMDCFTDQDVKNHVELDADAWRDVLQVLSHINLIIPAKSTRQLTYYSNNRRSAEVQQWAARYGERMRIKLRS